MKLAPSLLLSVLMATSAGCGADPPPSPPEAAPGEPSEAPAGPPPLVQPAAPVADGSVRVRRSGGGVEVVDSVRGYAFELPPGFDVRVAGAGAYLDVLRDGSLVLEGRVVGEGPPPTLSGEQAPDLQGLDERAAGAVRSALPGCLADGPDSRSYCDALLRLQERANAAGRRVIEFDLRQVDEVEGTRLESTRGPVFWIELPGGDRGLLLQPPQPPSPAYREAAERMVSTLGEAAGA